MQADLSGQISGQLPKAGTQQNGNAFHPQLGSMGDCRNVMQRRIFNYLILRQQPNSDVQTKKTVDIARRLEEGLFKAACGSMEEYMNFGTFESRLHMLIKRLPFANQNQHFSQLFSSFMGAMIPTPGMSHDRNPNLMVTPVETSMIAGSGCDVRASNINARPCVSIHGALPNGYQEPPSKFSLNSSSNNMISTMGGQRTTTTTMVPTPGLNSNNCNKSYVNLESSIGGVGFSSMEPKMVSQVQQQKQHISSASNCMLPGHGGLTGTGRSEMLHKSYGFSNGGLRMMGNTVHAMNGPGTSEGYLTAMQYGSVFGMGSSDASVAGNFSVPVSSVGSMMNAQNLDPVSLQDISQTNSQLAANQQTLQSACQASHVKQEPMDLAEKTSFTSSLPSKENAVPSHQRNLFQPQQQSQQIQSSQQPVQYNAHQRWQHMLKNDAFSQPQLSSDSSDQKAVHVVEHHNEAIQSQIFEQAHQNSADECTGSSRMLSIPPSQQNPCSSRSQSSQQMQQMMHPRSQKGFSCFATESQSESMKPGQWNSQSCDTSLIPGSLANEQHVQDEFCHGVALLNKVQRNNFSLDRSMLGQAVSPRDITCHQNSSGTARKTEFSSREKQFLNQQRWLLFMRHARRCTSPEGKCQEAYCVTAQKLWRHIEGCNLDHCPHPRCHPTKVLLNHYKQCSDLSCPVCVAVRNFLQAQYKRRFESGLPNKSYNAGDKCISVSSASLFVTETSDYTQPAVKRMKMEQNSQPVSSFVTENSDYTQPAVKRTEMEQNSQPVPSFVTETSDYTQPAVKRKMEQNSKPVSSLITGTPDYTQLTVKRQKMEQASQPVSSFVTETSDYTQLAVKRMKMEQDSQPFNHEKESSVVADPAVSEPQVPHNVQPYDYQNTDIPGKMKSESTEVEGGVSLGSGQGRPVINNTKKDNVDGSYNQKPSIETTIFTEPVDIVKQERVELENIIDNPKQEIVSASAAEHAVSTKSEKPKIKGVSLTELFTPEQIREHIVSLRQWVGQSKAKAEKNQSMEHSMNENSCQLCAVEKLAFEPPPLYCTPCGVRIKRNALYYTMGTGETRHYLCNPCYNESRGDTITLDGVNVPKIKLDKKKNDEETEEWWVQCDKCEAWQHQICALFNGRRNDGGQAEYTCANCYMAEIERGERRPLPRSAVLGAKDLPRTRLSDHIEQRLSRRLKQERQDRASAQGKSFDEVPGAEALVVRVVSSVDKKLEVKQRFLEIFQEENYPTEFPYKSKVVLLFQKIEGVEVCLFGMYLQEFGSECQYPNQRRVYLSYLDSVKYFRPDIKAVTGEALRTFVYHEILIGYLEYCKIRGFTSCYIWACPPLKGEDYILYCHPEIQKTPRSDKLREWYLSMLRKAVKEDVVVGLTNLYDHFFLSTGECKAKVTAARLPYFDGDYWPGAAEDMICQLHRGEGSRKHIKKATTKMTVTKRALRASVQPDLSDNASKDLLLMHKLGETISPMKEDFIMVHLQHACAHCCNLMVSGNRWVCNQCKSFQLCDKCYDGERKLEERERHPINQREKHTLYPVEINDVLADTVDEDEMLESEFFDTRQAFLSLCQGNHYQYDTLRRAKHSSMMVLYHLHNPTAPAFVMTCNKCQLDVESGQGWRCDVCPDYDVCDSCYKKDGGGNHPHKLTNHPSVADMDAQNKEARQLRVLQLRKMLDLLVHASGCRSSCCVYPNCRKVKRLFRHGIQCTMRASGGCFLCKKMWYLLQLHARACKESECSVPRCRDLKLHIKRLQQQSDSRRRAAVNEMMRKRAGELSGSHGR